MPLMPLLLHRPRAGRAIWVASALIWATVSITGMSASTPADSDGDGIPDNLDQCPSTPRGRSVDENGCCSAARALARGVEYLSRIDPSQSGDAFVAVNLRKLYPHPRLDRFIERSGRILAEDHSAWYFLPGRPLVKLPQPMPRGLLRWVWAMDAPHAEPREIADAILLEYLLTRGCAGYILTHQILILEIAKSNGASLPPAVMERRPEFLAAIDEEQRADGKFGDLSSERVMILLLYGTPKREEADRWIETIIAAQRSDGGWEDDAVYPIAYQGEQGKVEPAPAHTSILSAYSLGLYLARFGQPTSELPSSK